MIMGDKAFINNWLAEFKSPHTQNTYKNAINKFKKIVEIEDIKKYVTSSPNTISDMKKFLVGMSARPPKTVSTYALSVKSFLQDNGLSIPQDDWKKIRRRGFIPKRVRAQTQDKKPTKTQLKKILDYLDIKGKALVLFLSSSGCRIGETLLLEKTDLNLQADPPRGHIRGSTTKGEMSERTVFFSYETKDALVSWFGIKNGLYKRGRGGSDFGGKLVFPFSHHTAKDLWNRACDKAGLGQKDKRTNRRVYHIHGLRKFFRTKIGLDIDITNALMGHVEGLDGSYLRLEMNEIAEAYKAVMPNVSAYEIQNTEVREQTQSLAIDNQELKDKVEKMEKMMLQMQSDIKQFLKKLPNGE